MKRFTPLAWMISLLVVGSYVVLARPTAPVEPAMVRACSVSDVVAAAMTQRQLFATEDLGIIVLAGDKLMRFDSQLRKIGETEIQVDLVQMQRRIEQTPQSYVLPPQPIEVPPAPAESF